MEQIILYKFVIVLLLFIYCSFMKKYVNCSICAFTLHITTNVQTLCWSKTSPSFSGAHIVTFLGFIIIGCSLMQPLSTRG